MEPAYKKSGVVFQNSPMSLAEND